MTDAEPAAAPPTPEATKAALLDAILLHVPFDGWGEASFRAAVRETATPPALARLACPRGGLDLAIAFHARGDAAMVARLKQSNLSTLRFRDRIAAAVRYRLEAVEDREAVRRGAALLSLPQNAADGIRLIWGTADLIWTTLGDTSRDINWYTKRTTLAGVYSATVLYWLGDSSPGHQATWEFLDRRLDEVMRIEKAKGAIRESKLFQAVMAGPLGALDRVRPPRDANDGGLPGMVAPRKPH